MIFGVHINSSSHIVDKKKDILILSKGPTQELEHTLTTKNCIQLTLLKKRKVLFELALQWSK